MSATWIVERTVSRRFPFRISLEQDGRLILAVRAQAAWPGPGQQIFCLRERDADPAEPLEPVERVPVSHLTTIGRKIAIVLDRPQRKRCEFLTLSKPYRDGARGTYEQVFFRTEAGIRAHRSRTRVELRSDAVSLTVAIDSAERYPWRFPGAETQRRKLRAGDYALMDGDLVRAVVERKSFDNLLTDLGAVQALHHQLADLASCESAAVVVEAQFGDFLNPERLRGRWPAPFVGRVLGEIAALHPRLPIVYAGNRKLANLWAYGFFTACARRADNPQLELVREVGARYHAEPRSDLDSDIAAAALARSGAFTLVSLAAAFPGVPPSRVRRVLQELRRRDRVRCSGRGAGATWIAVGEDRGSAG